MPPPRLHPPHLHHPYRLFHLSARLRLRDRPSPSSQVPPEDDYYSLLLSQPIPDPSKKSLSARAPKSSNPASSPATPPPSAASTAQATPASIQGSDNGPDNRVLFSTPLAGPSARMRGLARGEKGLGRPPEPDNCCMSGCVNCVWDAYREEVEEWAAARRRNDREQQRHATSGQRKVGSGGVGEEGRVKGMGLDDSGDEGGVGDSDEVGGFRGMDLGGEDDGGLFEGLPVGIQEFMNTEKRLRERRAAEHAG